MDTLCTVTRELDNPKGMFTDPSSLHNHTLRYDAIRYDRIDETGQVACSRTHTIYVEKELKTKTSPVRVLVRDGSSGKWREFVVGRGFVKLASS